MYTHTNDRITNIIENKNEKKEKLYGRENSYKMYTV